MAPDTKKLSHREAKKEECRKGIARAAVRLFEEKGFDATTMDEIAHEAQVSRPTVFNYFPRKEDILLVLGVLLGKRISEQVQEMELESAADPVEAIGRILVAMASGFAEYPETSRAFHFFKMQDVHRRPRGEASAPPPVMMEQLQLALALIERGQALGMIRQDFKATELMHHLFIGLFASTIGPWFNGEHTNEALVSVVERHYQLYRQGIAR